MDSEWTRKGCNFKSWKKNFKATQNPRKTQSGGGATESAGVRVSSSSFLVQEKAIILGAQFNGTEMQLYEQWANERTNE